MALTTTQARLLGVVLAGAVLAGVVAIIVHRMREHEPSSVVVLDPPAGAEQGAAASISPGPAGFVIDASGAPVAGAEVLLNTPESYIDVYNTDRGNNPVVHSGKDGRFVFPSVAAWTDLVVRGDAGFAHVRADEMPADGRITLQPWGRIEGIVRIGSKPAAHQTVYLRSMMPRVIMGSGPDGAPRLAASHGRINLAQNVRTDENGRFAFARVVPGIAYIARAVSEPAGSRIGPTQTLADLEISPGQTVSLDVGGKGRPVIGRIVLDPPDEPLPLSGSILQVAEPQRRATHGVPENWDALSEQERQQFARKWLRSMLSLPNVSISIAADGTFHADDIVAGQYTLRVMSYSAFPDERGELLAEGQLTFTMPPIPGGRSDEPLDVGTITARVRPRVKIGAPAPLLEAVAADGSAIKLSDFQGRHVLLNIVREYELSRHPGPAGFMAMIGPLQDRLGSEDRIAMLAVILPERQGAAPAAVPSLPGWTMAAASDGRQLDPRYTGTPGMYLIDPEGKAIARLSHLSEAYGMIDAVLGPMRRQAPGVAVTMETIPAEKASPAFAFETIPTISRDDAGRNAIFSIVDGRKANFAGELRILNDGLGPRHERDESLMCTFEPGSLTGRIKADLGTVIAVEQINSYAWYKDSHRWAQVYRVYGSDGSAPNFDPEPKIGTDPATCGWSFIAAVDTRNTPGGSDLRDDIRGQSGVHIRRDNGPIGRYRYLLWVTLATETHNRWGQTFWTEIDIIGR